MQLDRQYIQTVWTAEEGLPQNSVNAILQTRDGYLWLGTFGGLVRFDGIKFTVFNSGNTPGLGAVSNIVKHSGATEARVTIRKNGREMEIEISDNGRGIISEAGESDSRPNGGFGLIGMAERARMLGGRCSLQSAGGSGTTVTVHVNLPEGQNNG